VVCAGGGGTRVVLSETLHSQIFCHSQKGVQLLLSHIHLSLVHEVENREQLLVLDALEVEEGMLVGIPAKDVPEERTASREDDLVSLHLGIITGESDIKEVLLLAEFSESDADVGLEVVPPQAKLLRGHLGTLT